MIQIFPARDKKLLEGLEDLCKYLKNESNIKLDTMVEVGSYIGESTEIFAKYFKTIYCIDTWRWIAIKDKVWKKSSERISEAEILFDKIIINKYENVKKLKSTSKDAILKFEDNSLDFIYIDGDHNYDSVKWDIQNWKNKLKKNSIISGHDYTTLYGCEGVIRAVDEVIGKPQLIFGDTSWIKKI